MHGIRGKIVLFILLICGSIVHAKHIVGGEMTYRCIEYNEVTKQVTLRISFVIYRDDYPQDAADFDKDAIIGIFKGSGSNWDHYRTLTTPLLEDKRMDVSSGIPCLRPPANIIIFRGYYEFDVVLDASDTDSYIISYQRCCRNNTILNIVDAARTGAAYMVEILPDAQKQCDNSAVYKDFPPAVICLGEEVNFDHSAEDMDGDSLVYSFCEPLQAGGLRGTLGGDLPEDSRRCDGTTPDPARCRPPFRLVNFAAPNYTYDKPMKGDPLIKIDPQTGLITGTPNVLGQFVVGVCVDSYKEGKLIGRTFRDFQFNVAVCEPNVFASVATDSTSAAGVPFVLNCGDLTMNIKNTSTDQQEIKSYNWEIYLNENDTLKYTDRDITVTFPDTGRYKGRLYLNSVLDLKKCRDTLDVDLAVYNGIEADFSASYDTCVAGPVLFTDESMHKTKVKDLRWNDNGQRIGTTPSISHIFEKPGVKKISFSVKDVNGCEATKIKDIPYYPVPSLVVADPTKFRGCAPERIQFKNLSSPIDSTYTVKWELSNGTTLQGLTPYYTFEEKGIYSVNLSIVSPLGCETGKKYDSWITILEGTEAAFVYTPEDPSIQNNTVTFTNQSKRAKGFVWSVDNELISREKDVVHTFPDTGLVKVEMIAFHENKCTDTARVVLDIKPINTIYMPTAFTPDDDGLNDLYFGKGYFDGIKDYLFVIYNRWGDEVFSTDDVNVKWNGRIDNTGVECPQGGYTYRIRYIDARNNPEVLKGNLMLLRE